MIHPDAQQVFLLSDYFHQVATAMLEYIQNNKECVGKDEERNKLYDKQIELLELAGEINMWGTTLVFEDVQEALTGLGTITTEVKKSIKKALAVHNAINIAASIVELGTAIILKDPKLIAAKVIAAGKAVGIQK